MSVLQRIVLVVLVMSALIWNRNPLAFAGQDSDQGKLQENRKQLIETKSCPGCNLSGVNLDRENLTGANLEGANLSKVKLHLATLAKANLRNTNLRDAEFGGSDLAEADLRGADLRGATFVGAYLVGAQLDKDVVLDQPSEELASETPSGQDIAEDAVPAQEEQGTASVEEKKGGQADVAPQNQPAEISRNDEGAAAEEPGFFDKTLKSVKGIFGQGEGEENQAVTEKREETVKSDEVIPTETPVVQAVSEKDAVVDIAPAKDEQPAVEAKGDEGAAAAEEPGFFDKTLKSMKGMFGQGEGTGPETVAEKADVAPPVPGEQRAVSVESQPPAAPVVVEESQAVSTEPAVVESKAGVIQEEKQSPESETAGVIASGDKPGSAADAGKNRERLLDTKRCYGCSLIGVDLSGKRLSGVDLEGADLTGSRLEGADLENANLKGALLVRADLRNADLRGADLYKANLAGADLTGARLDNALLDDAQLSDTVGYEQKKGQ